jgi:glycerophosphoryl diester phosphodiesterase
MSHPCFLQRSNRPLVLGHRGASADYPENTLLAFQQAMAQGADGVELDVMCCGSGEVVVVHDDDLGRVLGEPPGSGPLIRNTSLGDLRRYDLGSGQRVPLLAEALEALGPQALVNIELKPPDTPDLKTLTEHLKLLRDDGPAKATVEVLRRVRRPPGSTLVSSFDPLQLLRFARLCPELPLGLLFHRSLALPLRQAWFAPLLPLAAVHPSATLIDAVSMRAWRRRGYAVHTWTVDKPSEIAALCALGVDAIITNRPGATRSQLASS